MATTALSVLAEESHKAPAPVTSRGRVSSNPEGRRVWLCSYLHGVAHSQLEDDRLAQTLHRKCTLFALNFPYIPQQPLPFKYAN